MNKMVQFLKEMFNSIVLAGLIILGVGLFYAVIKAGIPYQDPPLELQIQYSINMGIGEELVRIGFRVVVFGIVVRILLGIFGREVF
ncbi:MAG: hypothetical protein IJ794_10130 [Lachnospiraceae bacterium]|nr:hypothetical protein [Lachnospiraceae bacterium]